MKTAFWCIIIVRMHFNLVVLECFRWYFRSVQHINPYSTLFLIPFPVFFNEKSRKTYILHTNPVLTRPRDKPSTRFRRSNIRYKILQVSCHLACAILTIHVIVSSRLLPPPPPTSEGATLGASETEETRKITTKYAADSCKASEHTWHTQLK